MIESHVRTTVRHSYNKDEMECLLDGIFLLFDVGLKLGTSNDDNKHNKIELGDIVQVSSSHINCMGGGCDRMQIEAYPKATHNDASLDGGDLLPSPWYTHHMDTNKAPDGD